MSSAAFPDHKPSRQESKSSVKNRVNLLKEPFFRSFSVVIAAVGHFPNVISSELEGGDCYFGKLFGVTYIGNKGRSDKAWINVSIRENNENPMLLIHCPQITAWITVSDSYLQEIADIIKDFAKERNINLEPGD